MARPLNKIGEHFAVGTNPTIFFGAAFVRGVVLNSTAVSGSVHHRFQCPILKALFPDWVWQVESTTPPLPSGGTMVRMSINGDDVCDGGVIFVHMRVDELQISPVVGPASGGTRVVLDGVGFSRTATLACRFGLSTVRSRL